MNTGLSFHSISKVRLEDLEGRIVKVNEYKMEVNLSSGVHGIQTNVWLTVDINGKEHLGSLFVNPE